MARNDIQDSFGDWADGMQNRIKSITPSDTTDLPMIGRTLMVSAAGNVAVETYDRDIDVLPGLQPGIQYVFTALRIRATGTTATGIKILE